MLGLCGAVYAQRDSRAEVMADWENGVRLRLRFAHDSTLMPFLSLLNGREATLPLPMAAPGSFCRWDEVKNL